MMPFPPEPMTIDQLKAHIDRRFDRLERTKADRSELRRLAATADRRWAVTKKAFSRFATKDDLRGYASRNDLKGFATKEDLKRFATKEDLKRFATKVDFRRLEDRVISMQKTLQAMLRHHGIVLDDHEVRICDLERHQ